MIEYLEKLINDKDYEKALLYAESLLDRENTPAEIAAINCSILTARMLLGQNHGAVIAGQLAVKVAMEAESWDYFALGCVNLGVVHARLRQYEAALNVWLQYLTNRAHYSAAGSNHEAQVWYNLGRVYIVLGDRAEGLNALNGALQAANRMADSRVAHGIRQALAEAYIQAGQLSPVPRLLAKCSKYLHDHPADQEIRDSRLWHWKLRAEYAYITKRSQRTISRALRGIHESTGRPLQLFGLHMLLARVFLSTESVVQALGHASAARVYATQSRRYDCEAEAADLMYQIAQGHPGAAEEMERFYSDGLASSAVQGELGIE